METVKEKLKTLLKQFSNYLLIVLTLVAGFVIGYYYDIIKSSFDSESVQVITVKRDEVKLAIDENNNLLVIKKIDGSYTVYQDSIGYMIFNLYAKNIWGSAKNTKEHGQ
jgi:uncharacterized membrane-anchored protein YitT (DUF2179 family)